MTKKTKISVGLSALACIGVGLTAAFAANNSLKYRKFKDYKASDKWEELSEEDFDKVKDEPFESILTKKDKAIILGKTFWPTFLSGTLTVGCIIGAQVLSFKEIAAFAGLAAVLGTKYKDLSLYLQEHYPEQYSEARSFINRKNAIEADEEYRREHIEETYDGRYRIYEPITEQIFYSKLTPEEIADKAQIFINKTLNNDNIVSVADYIYEIKDISGDKNLRVDPWMNKCGWCRDDDVFDYNIGYSQDGFWVGIRPEPTDDRDGDYVESLTMSIPPNDYSEYVQDLYDIPNKEFK